MMVASSQLSFEGLVGQHRRLCSVRATCIVCAMRQAFKAARPAALSPASIATSAATLKRNRGSSNRRLRTAGRALEKKPVNKPACETTALVCHNAASQPDKECTITSRLKLPVQSNKHSRTSWMSSRLVAKPSRKLLQPETKKSGHQS